jgi:hypothetical protein
VRDYRIEAEVQGRWINFAEVIGNHQRRRVHEVTVPVSVSALRVVVTATNGLDHARVCEIRGYGRP